MFYKLATEWNPAVDAEDFALRGPFGADKPLSARKSVVTV